MQKLKQILAEHWKQIVTIAAAGATGYLAGNPGLGIEAANYLFTLFSAV